MLDGMQRFGVQSLVCIGSIFGAVPHRGDVRMTGWANDEQLRQALVRHNVDFTNYSGPTGFATVLLDEAQSRGLPAVAVYAQWLTAVSRWLWASHDGSGDWKLALP
jgi:hypothetical protein